MTEAQESVYRYIADFTRTNEYPPTTREIAIGTGRRSPGNINRILNALRDGKYIDWEEGKVRTIRILR